jgi:hypothetical protein
MKLAFVLSLTLALALGCGGAGKPATEPEPAAAAPTGTEPAPAGADTDPAAPVDCADLCTLYAGCYEEVYQEDFRGGFGCVESCEAKTPEDQQAYATLINSGDCKAIIGE